MRIMVGIPVYDGKIQVEVVRCLLNEQALAKETGDFLEFQFLPNCSHAAMGRNQIAQQFMDSECDRLVFLDADVGFTLGSLLKVARHDADFVGGAYRFKFDTENYPVGWDTESKELWANNLGLIRVHSLPGGFLSLSKNVFQKLKDAYPDRGYEHFDKTAHCWFQMRFEDGNLYGEDSYFCKEWRDIGGEVFLDPELTLTHWEFNKPYIGHIGNWLKSRPRAEA